MNINKSVIVSILGVPNVGKSTLLNAIIGKKISIVSNKPQTTRTRITGILNRNESQMIFLDTPGIHQPKNRLGDFMVKIVNDASSDVDVVALVVEPNARVLISEQNIINKIKQYNMKAILVINKVDTVKKDELLAVIDRYSKLHDFDYFLPISAKNNDGIDIFLDRLEEYTIEGEQLYPIDMVSDMPQRHLAAEIIREKLLMILDKEVPHGIGIEILQYKQRENLIFDISANIYCERDSHKGIIIGHRGKNLKKVGSLARADIEDELECKVFLELWVKVKEDWRNNLYQMRNFGYDQSAF